MKITLLNLMGILAMLSLMGCEKLGISKGTPACINDQIEKWEKGPGEPPAEVRCYKYKGGETVYHIRAQCCDGFDSFIDSECNYICSTGGLSGKGDGKCLIILKIELEPMKN